MSRLLLIVCLQICVPSLIHANEISAFLTHHCVDCHSGEEPEGSINLTDFPQDLGDLSVRSKWERIHDRVANGEMPPREHAVLSEAEKRPFLNLLAPKIIEAVRQEQQTTGRGLSRRLNRVEYETALSDLLQMPLRIQEQLPADGKRDGFDTVGAGLNVSSVQMEAYVEVLDQVLDQATTLYERPEKKTWKLDYRDTNGIMQEYRRTGPFHILSDGVVFFAPEKHSHLNAVLDHFSIPYSEKYRVKVSAYAIRSEEPITLTIRTGGPGHSESDVVPKTLLGHVTTQTGDPQVFEFEQHLERGQFFRIYPSSLPYMRFVPNFKPRQKDFQGPGVVVQWVEVEGPIIDEWPPVSHQRLWSGIDVETLPNAEPNEDPNAHLDEPPTQIAKPKLTRTNPNKRTQRADRLWYYDPKQGAGGEPIYRRARMPKPLHPTQRFVTKNPKEDAARLLKEFAPLAFRRPIQQADVQPFIDLVHHWLEDGDDFETAMRSGYKALLCSPNFLYHQGSLPVATHAERQQLSEHALAERLSFFLWNSMPDAELRELAGNGAIHDRDILHQQVERMLNDPKAGRFLDNFLGQWLDLRNIDFTTPDSALYPEHDPVLQWSLIEETTAFFQELLENDLPVSNVIDSDFAMLNSRLAKHYGIPDVNTMQMRKVSLPEDSVRGGVLTHASVLKVTANGTTTSPVVRGSWVLDRIMGTPPSPPPPGIPAIEPDIRGATTVREQLEQHRNVDSCAACHKTIDPPGVALESFDVIGGWRENYRALNPETANIKENYLPNTPLPIKFQPGPLVDAADQMANGTQFEDIREFKAILLKDRDQIARTLVRKLVVYSTGAPISFADRVAVEEIINDTRQDEHGLRSLIHAVVQSDLFQSP